MAVDADLSGRRGEEVREVRDETIRWLKGHYIVNWMAE
jgi:hypothetical protein